MHFMRRGTVRAVDQIKEKALNYCGSSVLPFGLNKLDPGLTSVVEVLVGMFPGLE